MLVRPSSFLCLPPALPLFSSLKLKPDTTQSTPKAFSSAHKGTYLARIQLVAQQQVGNNNGVKSRPKRTQCPRSKTIPTGIAVIRKLIKLLKMAVTTLLPRSFSGRQAPFFKLSSSVPHKAPPQFHPQDFSVRTPFAHWRRLRVTQRGECGDGN
ncbi:hypothetical protein C8R45DRAFT_926051 [Mycena sanguinolenta]|nr:hypothetical protein C8R45DRAFT_926051 [Mycena sanguinolenta]